MVIYVYWVLVTFFRKGKGNMVFNSGSFLLFFPIVVCVYFLLPKLLKNFWLLLASYYFYMSWDAKYGLLLLGCTLITYLASLVIEFGQKKHERKGTVYLVLALLLIFGLLFYFKYINFVLESVQGILGYFGVTLSVPAFDIVLPVGISFFTFQAAGYLIDVYRGDIYAEKNFFRYALFVSFFPQLVAGPIERSKNLLKQLDRGYSFEFERVREGIYMMLWGFFMKLVIADRAAILVDQVFNNLQDKPGSAVVLATVLFAFQIYGDFGGYSMIAIGAAKVIGIDLMRNFDSPYFAVSSADFWRRWHVSLNTWFRDYLYIPLGGNRHGVLRKNLNLLIVFLVSGLWHGANWTYVVWGGINGLYQIIGNLTKGIRDAVRRVLHIREEFFLHRLFQILLTFVMTDFAWMFFRVNSMKDAGEIFRIVRENFQWDALLGQMKYEWGLNAPNLWVLGGAILLLLLVDGIRCAGVDVKAWILSRNWLIRTVTITVLMLLVLVLGVWGNAYDAQSFIYFQF